MRVQQIMTTDVQTCRPEDSLETVARRLWEHDCGVLPVVDDEGRVGAAITDRDVCMGAMMQSGRLADLRVADSMSRQLFSCRPEDDVALAAQLMAAHAVRRLPVVDDVGRLCGILSLNDLAVAAPRNAAVGRQALQVLTAVCTHRGGAGHSAAEGGRQPGSGASGPRESGQRESDPRESGQRESGQRTGHGHDTSDRTSRAAGAS